MNEDGNGQTGKFVPLAFSHVGIHVHDLDRMVDFYTRVMGFTVTDRGILRGTNRIVFTSWDPREHHQLVLIDGRPDLTGFNTVNQLSFRVENLQAVQTVWRRIKDEPDVSGVRGTNHGNALALYFLDPEGNRLEIFCDTPWYINQPCVEELDLSRPTEELLRQVEDFCKAQESFRDVQDWRDDLAQRIAARKI